MKLKKQYPFAFGRAGFTMVEILVVLAIGAILAAIAIGGLNTIIPRSQTKSAAQQLHADLQKAKMASVKNNRASLITFSEASGSDSGSITACFDDDDDDTCNSGETIIARIDMNDYKHAELKSASFSSGPDHFEFNPRGMPTGQGNFEINCKSDASYSLKVILSWTGRIRVN